MSKYISQSGMNSLQTSEKNYLEIYGPGDVLYDSSTPVSERVQAVSSRLLGWNEYFARYAIPDTKVDGEITRTSFTYDVVHTQARRPAIYGYVNGQSTAPPLLNGEVSRYRVSRNVFLKEDPSPELTLRVFNYELRHLSGEPRLFDPDFPDDPVDQIDISHSFGGGGSSPAEVELTVSFHSLMGGWEGLTMQDRAEACLLYVNTLHAPEGNELTMVPDDRLSLGRAEAFINQFEAVAF